MSWEKDREIALSQPLDHEAALQLAELKWGSNLARCYLDLHQRHAKLEAEHMTAIDRMNELQALLAQLEQRLGMVHDQAS